MLRHGLEVPSSRTVHPYSVHGELVKGWGFIIPCELPWWGRSGPEALGTVVLGDVWLVLSWGNLAWQGLGLDVVERERVHTDDSHSTIEGIR